MARIRTMNRRRWRKANPATWATATFSMSTKGQMKHEVEAIRAGHWVRFSPHPQREIEDFGE